MLVTRLDRSAKDLRGKDPRVGAPRQQTGGTTRPMLHLSLLVRRRMPRARRGGKHRHVFGQPSSHEQASCRSAATSHLARTA